MSLHGQFKQHRAILEQFLDSQVRGLSKCLGWIDTELLLCQFLRTGKGVQFSLNILAIVGKLCRCQVFESRVFKHGFGISLKPLRGGEGRSLATDHQLIVGLPFGSKIRGCVVKASRISGPGVGRESRHDG